MSACLHRFYVVALFFVNVPHHGNCSSLRKRAHIENFAFQPLGLAIWMLRNAVVRNRAIGLLEPMVACQEGVLPLEKPIRLSAHAQSYMSRRGFTREEVEEAILDSPWSPTERGRLNCRKDFVFDSSWNGTWYNFKQVRPVFVEEEGEIVIVIVTVYTYYF